MSTNQTFQVAGIEHHPSYNGDSSRPLFDYSLLELTQDLVFTREIGPVCLPRNNLDRFAGATATVVGWGDTTEGGVGSAVLRKAEITVLASDDCGAYPYDMTDPELCASARGRDACQGDSGGPLVTALEVNQCLLHVSL